VEGFLRRFAIESPNPAGRPQLARIPGSYVLAAIAASRELIAIMQITESAAFIAVNIFFAVQ